MKKKSIRRTSLSLALSSVVVLGAVPTASASPILPVSKVAPTVVPDSAPLDQHIIDEERLAKALEKRGVISKGMSPEARSKAVRAYIKEKGGAAQHKEKTELDQKANELKNQLHKKFEAETNRLLEKAQKGQANYRKGKPNGQVKVDPATGATYNGAVRTDKVLVLLVEYSDFKHNNVIKEDGYLYSDNFSREHFQQYMFGTEAFTLFNGDKVKTFKQYYEEQSGGSYTVDGTVSEWLTVPGTAKDYGGDNPAGGHDNAGVGARQLVKDALNAAHASGVKLAEYDQYDQYDLDGDGDFNEPDGLIDHLMIIHAGTGQEAGGGVLGDDAIWSHRWVVGNRPYAVNGTQAAVPYWGGKIAAFDYTIQPEDGAVGVFAHEFGHDLGLPDEYDTLYSGDGEPVQAWSIMSGGSWAGKVAGTQPTSFSPQNKEYFQKLMGGNWANITEINLEDIPKGGIVSKIDQSVTKSTQPGLIKINLPGKQVKGIEPKYGDYYYYSTKGDDLHTVLMTPEVTLGKTGQLKFDTRFEIEYDYDYLYLQAIVDGEAVLLDVYGDDNTYNYAESTKGEWVNKTYDLSAYAGKNVSIVFEYVTDGGLALEGFAFDNLVIESDGQVLLSDDAEGSEKVQLDGFVKSNGYDTKEHYYYLEWRNHQGSDIGLMNGRGVKYNTGLVVWYGDDSQTDNWVGMHPGDGFLGVVDSHPEAIIGDWYGQPTVAYSTRYQVSDAAFGLDPTLAWYIDSPSRGIFDYASLPGVPGFSDANKYMNELIPDAGRNVPTYGLKIDVVGEAKDNSAGAIWVRTEQ